MSTEQRTAIELQLTLSPAGFVNKGVGISIWRYKAFVIHVGNVDVAVYNSSINDYTNVKVFSFFEDGVNRFNDWFEEILGIKS